MGGFYVRPWALTTGALRAALRGGRRGRPRRSARQPLVTQRLRTVRARSDRSIRGASCRGAPAAVAAGGSATGLVAGVLAITKRSRYRDRPASSAPHTLRMRPPRYVSS